MEGESERERSESSTVREGCCCGCGRRQPPSWIWITGLSLTGRAQRPNWDPRSAVGTLLRFDATSVLTALIIFRLIQSMELTFEVKD